MIQSLSSTSGGANLATDQDGLAKVAKQFEAVFLRQMIGSMRQAGLSDDIFGSSAQDTFRDMGDARLADDMAGKGFGIAELITKQLGKVNAAQAPAAGSPPAGGERE